MIKMLVSGRTAKFLVASLKMSSAALNSFKATYQDIGDLQRMLEAQERFVELLSSVVNSEQRVNSSLIEGNLAIVSTDTNPRAIVFDERTMDIIYLAVNMVRFRDQSQESLRVKLLKRLLDYSGPVSPKEDPPEMKVRYTRGEYE